MVKIGIIGCGTIGGALAKFIDEKFSDKVDLVALCDIENKKAEVLSNKLKKKPAIVSEDELIRASDLVIEAASAEISARIAEEAIKAGKDAMIMSVGGLLARKDLFALAKDKNRRLYMPSGAICGLDGIKAAVMADVKRVCLTTRKPPGAFKGAPFIIKNKINLDSIKKETVLFEGPAKEAVLGFPQNINVAAILSLAGIGAERTVVRIITSPEYKANSHQIEAQGDFGALSAQTDNFPSPDNPKTSFLAVLSAQATLKQILETAKIGT